MMKNLCFGIIFLLFVGVGVSFAQAAPDAPCPVEKVCLSRAAAEKAVVDAETVKAQAFEIAILKQAISDQKDVAEKLKIELAERAGENTALRQNDVANRAIIELLVKKVGKRCAPLSILCL